MIRIEDVLKVLSELPEDFAYWVRTLNDQTYLGIMFVGAVTLTFVIARALR